MDINEALEFVDSEIIMSILKGENLYFEGRDDEAKVEERRGDRFLSLLDLLKDLKKERPVGKWIATASTEPKIAWCTNCHKVVDMEKAEEYGYCPKCGAKMIEYVRFYMGERV